MKHKFLSVILAISLIFGMTACQAKPVSEELPTLPQYPVTINETIISERPVRIATISPAMTDLIYGLGFGGRIVGVGDGSVISSGDETDEFDVENIGTLMELNMSEIKHCKPDILFTHTQLTDDQLRKLQQMYVTVVVIPFAQTIDEVFTNYETVSKIMLGETDGKAYSDAKIERYKYLLEKVSSVSKSSGEGTKSIYIRMYPLTLATGDTFENYILTDVLGFENLASKYDNWKYPMEESTTLEPELILYHDSIDAPTILEDAMYKTTSAAQNNKVLDVRGDYFERRSPQMFMELVRIAYELYPTEMPEDLANI
ncbi:MAG: ABC transporter substrate-binding protein [Oscillospiraceae bacterium]